MPFPTKLQLLAMIWFVALGIFGLIMAPAPTAVALVTVFLAVACYVGSTPSYKPKIITVFKKRGFHDICPLERAETYRAQETDVRFNWGPQFRFYDGSANDFYEKWEPEGLIEVFQVVEMILDPYEGRPFFNEESFLVARFSTVAAAVHCKLWLD